MTIDHMTMINFIYRSNELHRLNKMELLVDMNMDVFIAATSIIFCPLFWRSIASWEYKTKLFSKTMGSAKVACSILGLAIIVLGIIRNLLFRRAITVQQPWVLLQENWISQIGYGIMAIGTVLVVSSFLALGFFGTYLGDHFGILMEKRVTGFPYNICNNPMYWGTTLNFLGYAITEASPVGLLLTVLVAIVYMICSGYEEVFVAHIYNNLEEPKKK